MLPSIFAPGTLFARIFHASPVAMTVNALPDGAYLDVNDSFVRLVGYSRAELIGRRAIDLGIITPDKRQPVVQNLINKRQLANSPQELRHRSGAVRRVIVSAQVEEYEGELFTAAIIQDLTDYHHTQDALRTSEARFRLFFESVPLGVWVFDLETLAILDANPAACETYGYTLDELRAMTIRDICPPAEREAFEAFLPELRHLPSHNSVWRHCKKDGTIIDVAVSGYTLELNGRPVRLAVLRDITQQLAAERALIASEQRLQIITELSTDGIWDCDVINRTVQLNETFRLIYGAPEEPGNALEWWISSIHPDDRPPVFASIQEALAGRGNYWSTEFRMRRANSSYATVIIRGHIIRDEQGRATRLTGALVDISRQIEIAEAGARAALEERQRLARDLHDSVSQSLYSISLMAEAARRRADSDDQALVPEFIHRLGELSQQALRQLRLLVYELRPGVLAQEGLAGALRHRLEAVERRAGLQARLIDESTARVPLPLKGKVFHVAQEVLNHSLKFAAAHAVLVNLRTTEAEIHMQFRDDGTSDDRRGPEAQDSLEMIRRHVAELGGELSLAITADGATLIMCIPMGGQSAADQTWQV